MLDPGSNPTDLCLLGCALLQDMLRCQRGLPEGALSKSLGPAAWQQAVKEADSVATLRRLLGEVGCAAS